MAPNETLVNANQTIEAGQGCDLDRFLDHLYGDRRFHIQVCTLDPNVSDPKKAWVEGKPVAYMRGDRSWLKRRIDQEVKAGRNVYVSAHGYVDNRRGGVSANAAPIDTLWVEADGAPIPTGVARPTMTVETSPGRTQWYIKLTREIAPDVAADLNRRLAHMVGGDDGWHLTKRLRPPETINVQPERRAGVHQVRLLEVDDGRAVDPDELDKILPKLPPAPTLGTFTASGADDGDEPPIDLPPAEKAVWSGEHPVRHPNGDVDRSRTLLKIGAVLHEHNATGRTIVAELAARDVALGYNKYVDRPLEYARIAAKVATKPRKIRRIGVTVSQSQPVAVNTESADEDACSVELAKVKADLAESRRTISGIVQTFLNPYMPQSEKIALISALNLAEQKRQRGEVREDGSVELTAGDISQDFRPEPAAGESVAQTNQDGSKPRMKRQQVKPVIEALADRGFLKVTPRSVTRVRANGARYNETVWDATLPDKPSDILAMSATWKPDQPRMRKPRSRDLACPYCNEVHPIRRQDVCTGCGSIRAESILEPTIDESISDEPVAADEATANAETYVPKNSGHIETAGSVVSSHVHKNKGQGLTVNGEPVGSKTRPPTAPRWTAMAQEGFS